MITIRKAIQSEIIIMSMEEMVPENSIYRKIDKYIDFTFIYEKVKDLYIEKETGEISEYKGIIDKNGYKTYQSYQKDKTIRRHIKEEKNT